jgi:hypothetical protein
MLVPASMRAFTSAVLLLTFNLFGLGLGPFVTGLISDWLVRDFGMAENSLRFAISAAVMFSLLAGWLFWRASRYLPREMLMITEREPSVGPELAIQAQSAA